MVGWLALEIRRGRKLNLSQPEVLGLRLLRVGIPAAGLSEKRLRRRLRRGAVLLARAGVRKVVTEETFPFWDVLCGSGLSRVDPSACCQAVADRLALAALTGRGISPEQAVVELRGSRVDRPLFHAAARLCPQVKGLVISVPAGGAALEDYLRRTYGAAVLRRMPGVRIHLSVCFSGVFTPGEHAICLAAPAPELGGMTLAPDGAVPEGLDRCAMAALLWESGRLSRERVQIISRPAGEINLTDGRKIPIISY